MPRSPIPHTFEDRLEAEKARLERRAARLQDGSTLKDELLKKIRQLETAERLSKWLSSSA
jgi:hypothetical protein